MGRSVSFQEIGVEAVVHGTVDYEASMRRLRKATEGTSGSIVNASRQMNINIFSGAGRSIARFGQQISSLGSSISAMGFAMTFGLTVPIAAATSSIISAGREFELALLKIQNLAGVAEQDMAKWGQTLLNLGPQLAKTPIELADAMYYLASVGIRDAGLLFESLTVTAKGSAVGMGEMADIAKALAGILSTFPDAIPSEVMDSLFVAIREGGGEVEDLASQLGRVLAVGKQVGATVPDMLAFISTFTRSGVTSAVATTSLLNVLSLFSDPPKASLSMLEKFSIDYNELRQQLVDDGLGQTLEDLYAIMGTDMAKIFTQRGTYGAFDVVNAEEYLEIAKLIKEETGALDKAFLDYVDSTEFQFKAAAANMQSLGITIFQAIKGPLAEIMKQLNEFLARLREIVYNNPKLTEMALKFALIAAAMGPVLVIAGQLIRSLGTIAIVAAVPLRVLGSLAGTLGGLFMTAFRPMAAIVGLLGSRIVTVLIPAFAKLGAGLTVTGTAAFKLGRWFLGLSGIVTSLISRFGLFVTTSFAAAKALSVSFGLMVTSVTRSIISTSILLPILIRGQVALALRALGGFGNQITLGAAAIAVRLAKMMTSVRVSFILLPIFIRGQVALMARSFSGLIGVLSIVYGSLARFGAAAAAVVAPAFARIALGASAAAAAISARLVPAMARLGAALTASVLPAIISVVSGIVGVFGTMAAAIGGAMATAAGALVSLMGPILAVAGAVGILIIAFHELRNVAGKIAAMIGKKLGSQLDGLKDNMDVYGENIMIEFGKGMLKGMIAVVQAIRAFVRYIERMLRPGSPPKALPDLTEWGSGAIAAYMEGWTQFDFDAFSGIADKFQEFFNSLIPSNDEGNAGAMNAIANLLEFRNVLADVINEINTTGDISAQSWLQLTEAMQGASAEMQQYVRLSLQAAQQQEKIADIQDEINATQRRYDDLLKPISKRLAEIQEERDDYVDERRIEELNKILADARAPEDVKRFARLELEEIGLEEQQESIESMMETELDTLNAQLEVEQATLDAILSQLAFFEDLVDLQLENARLLKEYAEKEEEPSEEEAIDELAGDDWAPSPPLEFPEFEPPGNEFADPFAGLTDPIGNLDTDLANLMTQLGGLKFDLTTLKDTFIDALSNWWDETVKVKWDAVMAHPLVVDLGRIFTGIGEDWDNMTAAWNSGGEAFAEGGFWSRTLGWFMTLVQGIISGFMNLVGAVPGLVFSFVENFRRGFGNLREQFEGVRLLIDGFVMLFTGQEGGWTQIGLGVEKILETLFKGIGMIPAFIIDFASRLFVGIVNALFSLVAPVIVKIMETLGMTTADAEWAWIEKAKQAMLDFVNYAGNWGSELWAAFTGWFQKIYDDLVGHSIIPDMLEAIKLAFTNAWADVKQKVIDLWLAITTKFEEIKAAIWEKVDLIRAKKDEWMAKIGEVIIKIINFVKEAVREYENFKTEFGTKVDAIKTKIGEWITKIGEVFTKIVGFVRDAIPKYEEIRFAIEEKINLIKGYIDTWKGKIDELIEKAGDMKRDVIQFFKDLAGEVVGFINDILTPLRTFIDWLGELIGLIPQVANIDWPWSGDPTKSGNGRPAEPPKPITNTNSVNVPSPVSTSQGNSKTNTVTFGDTIIQNDMTRAEFETRVKRIMLQMMS